MSFESSLPPSSPTLALPLATAAPPARAPGLTRTLRLHASAHWWAPRFALALVVPVYAALAHATHAHVPSPVDAQDARRIEAQTLLVLNTILFTLNTSILSVFYAAIATRVVLHAIALFAMVASVTGMWVCAFSWTDACTHEGGGDGAKARVTDVERTATTTMDGACVATTAWALLSTFLLLNVGAAAAARSTDLFHALLIFAVIGALVGWAGTACSSSPSLPTAAEPVSAPVTVHITGRREKSWAHPPVQPASTEPPALDTQNIRESTTPLVPKSDRMLACRITPVDASPGNYNASVSTPASTAGAMRGRARSARMYWASTWNYVRVGRGRRRGDAGSQDA